MATSTVVPSAAPFTFLAPSSSSESGITAFEVLSQKLRDLGGLTVSEFLNGPRSVDDYWSLTRTTTRPLVEESDGDKTTAIQIIHETAQRIFGNADCLGWDFPQVSGGAKQCILTITRPSNGNSRTYTTTAPHTTKQKAKLAVSQLAIAKGVLDFIKSGDSEYAVAKKSLLAPIDNHQTQSTKEDLVREDDESVEEIETCCRLWRRGRVQPVWVSFGDFKDQKKFGSALRVSLTPNILRTYSVAPIYDSPTLSKHAVAREAISQDVLDFIRYGNGQTEMPAEDAFGEPIQPIVSRRAKMSLQAFYETLQRPFPEDFGDKTAHQINPQGWLNRELQAAMGGGVRAFFYTIGEPGMNVHGCVLRVESFEDYQTYLLDPCISKRGDVRGAVVLLGMSQGLGAYLRNIARTIEAKMSPAIRQVALRVEHVISAELAQRHIKRLRVYFDHIRERDAFGCSMRVELSPLEALPQEPAESVYFFKAPPRYRNKLDAKLGACYLGAEEGAVELMRFRGQEPPPTYVSFFPGSTAYLQLISSGERKRAGDEEDRREGVKKRKVDGPGKNIDTLRSEALHSLKVMREFKSKPARGESFEMRASESSRAGPSSGPVRRKTPPASKPTITRFPPPPPPLRPVTAPQVPPPPALQPYPMAPPPPPPMVYPHPSSHAYHHHPVVPPAAPSVSPFYHPSFPQAAAPYPHPHSHSHHYPVHASGHFHPSPYTSPYAPPIPMFATPPPSAPLPMMYSPPSTTGALSPPPRPSTNRGSMSPTSRSGSTTGGWSSGDRKRQDRDRDRDRERDRDRDKGGWGRRDRPRDGWKEDKYSTRKKVRDDEVDEIIKKATKITDKQALIDYCSSENIDEPMFFNRGGNVGIMIEDEKFELPRGEGEGLTIEEKEVKLSRIVLGKLKSKRKG
ncbi:hypothetical protein DL96DRAFT_1498836 [Flagelloscypha sp. PMI_526]|nr:hypothetical protein DL96DRAFT_1498836 [Flagelloscypha sp. PMI_526]